MKKAYLTFLKGINGILVAILGLLGIQMTGCFPIVAYGSPYADYVIKGKVTNTSGTGITGIEVKAATQYDKEYMDEEEYPYKSLTNTEGEYRFTLKTSGPVDFTVYANDIDGEMNGLYQSDSIFIEKDDIKLHGSKGWYEGGGKATVNFKLKEATKTEDQLPT